MNAHRLREILDCQATAAAQERRAGERRLALVTAVSLLLILGLIIATQ